jgi:formate dehydrogenase iron-sulfur subunit
MDKAILYDSTLCTACRACQVACKQWNNNDGVETVNLGSYENPPELTPETWLKIEFREVEREGKVGWLFNRRACMHCTEAVCVRVCPTGALTHHELGFVTYDKDLCSGCGYCVDFCPFNVPRSDRNLITGLAKMDKCTFCTTPGFDRLSAGYEPACVKSCPTDALKYGDRDELVVEARQRINVLKTEGHTNAYLYGEEELGGLHVMYVLDDSPEVYGLPVHPEVPAAAIAWQDVIQPLGWAVGGLALIGLGLNYLVARKAKMTRELPDKKEKSNATRS